MAKESWTKVAREADLKEGIPISAEVGGEQVLLVRLNGRVHACGGKCTHYGAPLAEGVLVGNVTQVSGLKL